MLVRHVTTTIASAVARIEAVATAAADCDESVAADDAGLCVTATTMTGWQSLRWPN